MEDLGLREEVLDVVRGMGITSLYPPQYEALKHTLDGKSLVMSVPTASGKSLVAYLTIVNRLLEAGGKALYIVPLRALAAEKYIDLQRFSKLGLKVVLTVGDYDSPGADMAASDVIVATSERADSLLRHRTSWIKDLQVVVADEVHLIHDPDRGPTLEVLLTRFRMYCPDLQILALSATAPNARELADWLGAETVVSSWRPVDLIPCVHMGDTLYFEDDAKKVGRGLFSVIKDALEANGQCLVFTNTRRSAESTAEKLRPLVYEYLTEDEIRALEDGAREIAGEEEATSFAGKLASILKWGCAYHHAGLTYHQRRIIEGLFRERLIKVLTATPTLAAGVNLPARRVIIKDIKRWDASWGAMKYLPVMEVKQMLGRAGRPGYDPVGEAVLMVSGEKEMEFVWEVYIKGQEEELKSRLGAEGTLRSHILSSIVAGYTRNWDELLSFIGGTFYAHQHSAESMLWRVEETLNFLVDAGMVEHTRDGFRPTPFGERVSSLYIDPYSGIIMREGMENAGEDASELQLLVLMCGVPDMLRVSGYLRNKDVERVTEIMSSRQFTPLVEVEDPEAYYGQLNVAMMLEDWINEMREEDILEKYSIAPGDLRTRVETAQWLMYALAEIGRILGSRAWKKAMTVSTRMTYGIKEELVDLVKVRGIGRVRARALFDAGIRTREDLRASDIETLANIRGIGRTIGEKLLKEVAR